MEVIEIIQWLNENNGFAMALLTLVYVIATILICIFNYKSAKSAKEQTKESYNQFIENNRAHIIPKIIEIEGEMICLSFQNVGKDIAKDVVIDVNEEWLKKLEKTETFPKTANSLRILKNKKIFLTIDQQLCYGMYIPGNGKDDFSILKEETLIVKISYKTLNKAYYEEFEISLDSYNYLINSSDYTRLTKKQIKEIKNINEKLENINDSLKNLEK